MRVAHQFAVALAFELLVACTVDNGLPTDLRHHLAERGIELQELESRAPLSGRYGHIVARKDMATLQRLTEDFAMRPVAEGAERSHCLKTLAVAAVDVWAITGRPASLKLRSGAQFEYMCVVTTPDNKMYVVAEYAYG